MIPIINGNEHHFGHRGLYRGLSVLGDSETGSFWDHITGQCLLGPLIGHTLETSPLIHTNIEQALRMHPRARLAVSRQSLFQSLMGRLSEWTRLTRRGFLPPGFRSQMRGGDSRRPVMELGLGVWTDRAARFYPLDFLRRRGGAMTDLLDEIPLVIFIDPATMVPTALKVESLGIEMQPDKLVFADGAEIRDSMRIAPDGSVTSLPRPLQLFTRWYGFSFTFPRCDIAE